ncbi:DUF3164 family protein [Methylophilus sp. DW102]|uniref:DUF3164 family protein n=1 Tax=Methylophilus sp. DW102 TaxID=3095607 RepID=UPI003087E099|nr:DUF3164 family protein [Methylophilus sp. DW102]
MQQIPEGYKQDASGNLVPLSKIKPIDLARDDLVLQMVAEAKHVNTEIAEFKSGVFADILAFVDLSAEQYDVKLGGKKGNVTLYSFDGRYKVQLAISETLVFDERLQAAKALIDSCINSWNMDDNARVLINDAFRVDKEGKINTGRVLGLHRLNIQDEAWKKAMQAIGDSVQVAGSKRYVRFYERVGDSEKYEAIRLDIAAV